MDANGSRFHLLLGQADWSACLRETDNDRADADTTPLAADWAGQSAATLPRLGWDARQQALMLPALAFRLRDAPREGDLDPAHRRGAAADAHGQIYWLEADGIHRYSPGDGRDSRFWPLDAATCQAGAFQSSAPAQSAADLHGLAVLSCGHLVVGLRAAAPAQASGLLVFDLHTGGPPRRLLWPAPPADTPAFRPVDLASRGDGGLWLLDAGPAHCRVWALDRQLDWLPLQDQAASDDVFASCALALPAKQAVALTALDNEAWVLDNAPVQGACGLWRVVGDRAASTAAQRLTTRALIDLLEDAAQAGFQLQGHDLLALPDGRLLLVGLDGNQVFAFQPGSRDGLPVLDALPEYRPLRRYTPRGLILLAGRPHYASQGLWIPLVEQARPRHVTRFSVLTPNDAAGALPPFDGVQPGCVWHRVFLDVCLPPGCGFELASRAAERIDELALTPWQAEPTPYRRGAGSELPWLPNEAQAHTGGLANTWETLLQNARGRYLQLRLTLLGNGRATPRINALRVYYPRFSWLEHYLPAAWRRDPVAAAFVDRWLANPEGLFTALEDRLSAVHCLFDARSTPPEYLDWLAGWFGLALTEGWSTQRKRLLLRHADRLFRERGTHDGLLRALRLAVDPDAALDAGLFAGRPGPGPWGIRLVEHFLRGADDWPESWDAASGSAYRAFLARRYGHIEQLAQAWQLQAAPPVDFSAAAGTAADPAEGSASADRTLFARVIQPARRRAHRFSVLLPKQDCDASLSEKVRQVLAREAPAHTVYEIAEYDLALRVGSARLGVDSVLGAAAGWTPLIVEQSHLGMAFLAATPAPGRWPADRYPIGDAAEQYRRPP